MTDLEKRKLATKFASSWLERKGYEKGETSSFWRTLLHDVFHVQNLDTYIEFERKIPVGFIDAYIPSTKVLIEQKSRDVDIGRAYLQSDGSKLTPYQQAKRYADELPNSERPRWIVVCNFEEFHIHDLEHPHDSAEVVYLKDLGRDYHRLNFLVDINQENVKVQEQISFKAGDIVSALYEKLLKQYKDPSNPETLKSLNKLCVRLVFCLYAEDAGLFAKRNQFNQYLSQFETRHVRKALIDLFRVLNTREDDRDPYIEESLAQFPYVNGGLFADENIEIPFLTDEIVSLILREGSENFDWSQISPTVFGSLFESTLNPITRSQGGMHYTSIENIHKVIDPLFLDDLRRELNDIRALKTEKTRNDRLRAYQDKLSNLSFLDPACGSGNFLTETYLCLRRLENEVISILTHGQSVMGDIANPIKVNIGQFYGIEINDFAVSVAQTALWIAESQMRQETSEIVYLTDDYLPLRSFNHIVEGNACRLDWNSVVQNNTLSFVIGNPPFTGHQLRNAQQVEDMDLVFESFEKYGKIDYVGAWFKRCADYIKGCDIPCALVATNSVCQGESASQLWEKLFEDIEFNFAYRTFEWENEAVNGASVHCVIIGFSNRGTITKPKVIYDGTKREVVGYINGYLVDGVEGFISNRSKLKRNATLMPPIVKGSQPTDENNFFLTEDEYKDFVSEYPQQKHLIRKFIGAREYLHNVQRYCFWLDGVNPVEFVKCDYITKRLEKIRVMREASPTETVRLKDSKTPWKFTQIRQPNCDYLVIPSHSSHNRAYIPFGYSDKMTIVGNACYFIPDTDLYIFGVMSSSVHMLWLKEFCGRLKSDVRYSPFIYNSFPWLDLCESDKDKVRKSAQKILDAREKYSACSLHDLYGENMSYFSELVSAHEENDKTVRELFGYKDTKTDREIVADLMGRYIKLKFDEENSSKKMRRKK